tara:strand:+ start:92 stop:1012 length:921 start_codon:yes stop_codon:yes gene_type:complete
MKKVVVTGANGFVGKAFTASLVNAGHEVFQLNSSIWDIREPPPSHVIDKFKNAEIIFHLAAYIPKNYSDLKELQKCNDVNGLGTFNVLTLAHDAGIENFVHVSSANLLQSNGLKFVDKDSPYDCSRAMPYLSSKVLAEMYVKGFYAPNMMKLIVRPSSLYSIDKPCSILSYIKKCVKNESDIELYNNGSFAADYLLLGDFIKTLTYIAETPKVIKEIILEELSKNGYSKAGILNVGSGRVTRHLDIARQVCFLKNLDPWKVIKFRRKDENRKFGFGAIKESNLLKDAGFNPVYILDQKHFSKLVNF